MDFIQISNFEGPYLHPLDGYQRNNSGFGKQAFIRILISTPIQMLQKTTATKIESLVHPQGHEK